MEKKAWWDKLGAPQYGDEMVIRVERDIVNFDPYFIEAGMPGVSAFGKEDPRRDLASGVRSCRRIFPVGR